MTGVQTCALPISAGGNAGSPAGGSEASPRTSAATARTSVAPVPSEVTSGDEVRVRNGDSLSRIAGRTQRQGVSLDQMLVALFRANPQAFMAENMNRLKAGAVLTVPSPEDAGKVTTQAAREVIQAQSADFGAYRQRLASGVTTTTPDAPARQAKGQVQTQVEDRKQAAAPTPDRLTLSQGGVKASAPEAKLSKETERKDSGTRLAELSRNVDELKKLHGATTPAAAPATPGAAATPAAPAAKPGTGVAPTVVAAAPPAAVATPAPTPAPVAPAPAPVTVPPSAAPVASMPAVASTMAASAAVAAASVPASAAVTAAVTAAASAAAPNPVVKPVPKPVVAAAEPGLLDSLSDNSLLLPAAGVLVALLGAFGLYRLRGRMRKPAGETSFLESRLQPDSFFGASGGQRIDTREAAASTTGNSSSMSYSLSQLDAIGDVDPVAEADVYLAYGRDLQAEEILKEAMRSTPERLAIRSKLLEVYAKRRDAKGFELLASQLFNLTRGEGEDWAKAQEMGRSIDPDNELYQPGGQPEEVRGAGGQVVEPLGASTVPYTAPVQAPAFQPAADATLDGVDLDLDLPLGPPAAPVKPSETTQPIAAAVEYRADEALSFEVQPDDAKTVPVRRPTTAELAPSAPARPDMPKPAAAALDDGLDFDLETLAPPAPARSSPGAKGHADGNSLLDFGDFTLPAAAHTVAAPAHADGTQTIETNPLARKLELAEEFRQIGDLEGARDLLEEVIAKADGALQSKAQGMLAKLG